MACSIDLPDETETQRAGAALAPLLAAGDALALVGDLGAGKTALVRAAAAALGCPGVTSPTFALVHQLRGGRLPVAHVDLYRLERADELVELGLDELWAGDGVVFVEWADRFAVMPAEHLRVELHHHGAGRRLVIAGRGPRGEALASAWCAALAANVEL